MGFDVSYPLVIQNDYGTSPFLVGKLTISMAVFNSYVATKIQRVKTCKNHESLSGDVSFI